MKNTCLKLALLLGVGLGNVGLAKAFWPDCALFVPIYSGTESGLAFKPVVDPKSGFTAHDVRFVREQRIRYEYASAAIVGGATEEDLFREESELRPLYNLSEQFILTSEELARSTLRRDERNFWLEERNAQLTEMRVEIQRLQSKWYPQQELESIDDNVAPRFTTVLRNGAVRSRVALEAASLRRFDELVNQLRSHGIQGTLQLRAVAGQRRAVQRGTAQAIPFHFPHWYALVESGPDGTIFITEINRHEN